MINIENLSKNYWNINILKNTNLKIKEWEFVSIIWPSWSWKSTILNLLSWIDRDFKWDIIIDNKNIKDLKEKEITDFRAKYISYIFQDFKLIDNLTIKENIDLIISMNNLERNFETKEIVKLVWLEDRIDNYVYNLSGWEKQRVAIARAFVWKTKIMLADEPTWALDIENKDNIMQLIIDLHKKTNITIIMITHDDSVANMSDKIYKIKNHIITN